MKQDGASLASLPQLADGLLHEAIKIRQSAKTEEELKIGFEQALYPVMQELGIKYHPSYERLGKDAAAVYKGRPDAVHGMVVIEYENPGCFESQRWIDHAHGQLVEYIKAEAAANKQTLFIDDPKYIGVGFDGYKIFFTRYRGDKTEYKSELKSSDFVYDGPYEFSEESARTLLTYLRSLSRKPLKAEYLAAVFGPEGNIAPLAVSAFADSLEYWGKGRVRVFFDEWKRLFGIVYGEQFNFNKQAGVDALSKLYKVGPDTDFQELLFSVHTYFALLMKLIVAELITLKETSFGSSYSLELTHLEKEKFKKELGEIEDGGMYAKRGISNFLEGDFFRWYLDAWSPRLEEAIREITRSLSEFEPATTTVNPEATRDLLKKLYQYLVPQEVRHGLGEYYTPDWLAELLIDEVGYQGDSKKRFLDPACGSGTFLVMAIQKIKEKMKRDGEDNHEVAKRIIANVWGFDLNPLAVIAARTNYIFALGDMINKMQGIEIPVYLADSVLWPQRNGQMRLDYSGGENLDIQTSVGLFHVPKIWTDGKGLLMQMAALLTEEMVKNGYSPEEALRRYVKEGLAFPPHEDVVMNFYAGLLELEKQGKDGIWARFLKNAFAPMMAGRFDYVIGNPPWIRWGYLSDEYRQATLPLWKNYGLFSLKGNAARLGGGEKDFSMLFTYAACDYYLSSEGNLGFLITQEAFKSKGAGEGFRHFHLGEGKDGSNLKVLKALDFVSVQPFEGATNKTAAIILKKGEITKYPLPYFVYTRKKGVGKISPDSLYKQALVKLVKEELMAQPMGEYTASWQTMGKNDGEINKIQGTNTYKARQGVDPQPYGVFLIKLKQVLSDNQLLINNIFDRGKSLIPSIESSIESKFVFPSLSGAEIRRWYAKPLDYILMVQDPNKREPISEVQMKQLTPRTYSYLLKFREQLLSRGSKSIRDLMDKSAFYAMFGVGEYTMSRYKVVWKFMSDDIYASVTSQARTPFGHKQIMPIKTVAMFCINDESEAHYLCAIINSQCVREFIKSFSSAGRGFGTPSVMEHVGIPKFDQNNSGHIELAGLSKKLHELKELGRDEEVPELEKKVDEKVNTLFGIS